MVSLLFLLVFDLCRKMRALAVLFRQGRKPPLPQSLELNLRARKRSLEDQEDLVYMKESEDWK
jgi:hypothetical protein